MSDVRVAILYPTDPAGSVPSGIDSFIKGFLKKGSRISVAQLFGPSAQSAVT